METPLIIDLCCGTGAWTRAFRRRGFTTIGVDIAHHKDYKWPMIIQDVRTLHPKQLSQAHLIVASPPCTEYARHGQPWTRAKNPPHPDCSIAHACFYLAAAAGVPIILENVREAQRFLGPARTHFDSFYLWGDGVPALIPRGTRTPWKSKLTGHKPMSRAKIPPELAEAIAALC